MAPSTSRHALVPAHINGRLEFLVYQDDHLTAVDTAEVANGRITTYRRVLNPEKLTPLTNPHP
jgi:hypothetical protein